MSVFGGRAAGERLEKILASPNYREGRFRNLEETAPGLKAGKGLSTARELLFGDQRRTPPGELPRLDPRATWRTAPETGLRATWLGHSTVLLEIDGARVLTDPVWCERASPSQALGPRRFAPVPVGLPELPRLDAVLISHDHYDHLDMATVRHLATLDVPLITALGVGAHLEAWGAAPERIIELDWWEGVQVPGTDVTITATPARHFSGRTIGSANRTLWASWVFAGPRSRAFFSGDTGLTGSFADIRERLGPFDLVMLEVGAFHENWGDIHLGPANALLAHEMLGSPPLLPVHWGTFKLAFHPWDEPAEVLLAASQERSFSLLTPRIGGAVEPAIAPGPEAWWRRLSGPARATRRGTADARAANA